MTSLALAGDAGYEEPKKPLFRPTDSDYVKLAKQGGASDLLEHHANEAQPEAKRKPYKSACEWYKYDDTDANNMPVREKKDLTKPVAKDNGESAMDIRKRLQKKYQNSEAPFFTDGLSYKERETQEATTEAPRQRQQIKRYPM